MVRARLEGARWQDTLGMLDLSLAAPGDGVRDCLEPAAGGMGLLPQQGLLAPRKGFPQHEFRACLGLGVTQATSTPLISLFPWLGWGNTLLGLPGPLCSPLQVSNAKLGQAGRGSSEQGGNPSAMLIVAPVPPAPRQPLPCLQRDAEGHN